MIFNWLNLLDKYWVIIILMLVVSGFTMICPPDHHPERTMIGMLKSMVPRISVSVGSSSTSPLSDWPRHDVGNIIALLFCIIQERFQILKLDPPPTT